MLRGQGGTKSSCCAAACRPAAWLPRSCMHVGQRPRPASYGRYGPNCWSSCYGSGYIFYLRNDRYSRASHWAMSTEKYQPSDWARTTRSASLVDSSVLQLSVRSGLAPRRRRPHPPPAPQPLSWLERGRRSPRLVGGLLRTGHRRHHGTTHPHRPTAQQARQIQQDPGPPRPPPPHHVVPAGIRTSSSTSGVEDRRKRPRRVSGENFAHETHR